MQKELAHIVILKLHIVWFATYKCEFFVRYIMMNHTKNMKNLLLCLATMLWKSIPAVSMKVR